MRPEISGFGFLLAYILMVGVASFLEKFSMKQLNPYQVNFLMAIGMAVTAVPALWIKQGTLVVPLKSLPVRRTNRVVNGFGFDLFCAGSGKASSRHGHRNFHKLRGRRDIAL